MFRDIENFAQNLQSSLGGPLRIIEPLSGGCIHQVFRCTGPKGNCVLKYSAKAPADMFEAEAEGLERIGKSRNRLTPQIISHSPNHLLLSEVQRAPATPSSYRDLGEGLALLHQHSAQSCGLDRDGYLGHLPQSNRPRLQSWPSFYAEKRLLPLAQIAIRKEQAPHSWLGKVETLCKRLVDLLPTEAHSLLHGDLWSGNILHTRNGRAVLIDPAVYFGHREVDLAMLELFGPRDQAIVEAYQGNFPLLADYQDRRAIYQLYPLLAHLCMFGNTYFSQCNAAVQQYL